MAAEFRAISEVVALVTGAASGLGRATAARLVKQVLMMSILYSIKLNTVLLKIYRYIIFEDISVIATLLSL